MQFSGIEQPPAPLPAATFATLAPLPVFATVVRVVMVAMPATGFEMIAGPAPCAAPAVMRS